MDITTLISAKKHTNSSFGANIKIPLDIPTYDGNPQVAHPSVVFIPEGFGGYRYWMAFTPYPDGHRENPSVIASHNGVDWEEPAGITNPVAPLADVVEDGYNYQSDPDLLLVDNELWLYYRVVKSTAEAVYLRKSSNGITWSDRQLVLLSEKTAEEFSKILSPSIVLEDDGSFSMWTVNNQAGKTIEKRTSVDGVNFGSAVTCTMPDIAQASVSQPPWHIDVIYENGLYHMLISAYGTWDLLYLYSSDGDNWASDLIKGVIEQSGRAVDSFVGGYYRSTMIPVPGNPTKFDIYANALGGSGSGSPTDEQTWRIVLFKNVDVKNGRSVYLKDVNRLWIPASQFVSSYGTDVLGVQNQQLPYRSMEAGIRTRLNTSIITPGYFDKVFFRIYWANQGLTYADMNVRFVLTLYKASSGGDITSLTGFGFTDIATVQAQPQHQLVISDVSDYPRPINISKDDILMVRVEREGSNALDTLSETISFIGVEINFVKNL